MYKTTYVCDCCGKEMQTPMYTLELRTNNSYIQDRVSWHYCNDCGGYIKKSLTEKNNKDIEQLKKDNEWYKKFFMSMYKSFMDNLFDTDYYTTITTSTSGEKTIQAKPMGDGPFTAGCCCESVNKDDLDYKQTVGMI